MWREDDLVDHHSSATTPGREANSATNHDGRYDDQSKIRRHCCDAPVHSQRPCKQARRYKLGRPGDEPLAALAEPRRAEDASWLFGRNNHGNVRASTAIFGRAAGGRRQDRRIRPARSTYVMVPRGLTITATAGDYCEMLTTLCAARAVGMETEGSILADAQIDGCPSSSQELGRHQHQGQDCFRH